MNSTGKVLMLTTLKYALDGVGRDKDYHESLWEMGLTHVSVSSTRTPDMLFVVIIFFFAGPCYMLARIMVEWVGLQCQLLTFRLFKYINFVVEKFLERFLLLSLFSTI